MKRILLALVLSASTLMSYAQATPTVWQWSVQVDSLVSKETNDYPRAFLWVPENCKKVRAVVFAQHNMVEEGMLEHSLFRKTMSELGIAEVWVTPGINMPFDFTKGAGENYNYMMKLLANVSGYEELTSAPVIPIGHSAYATFPWNFAAWNRDRTVALISVHGDAPQTRLTGYGGKNVDWDNKNIDGVPALFIMGEFEWWEDRLAPAFSFIANHPKSVISLFCDAGHGHFDYSEEMIDYVCRFIKKAVKKRLPLKADDHEFSELIPVDPQKGWLMDRWHKDSLPMFSAAPYALYKGDHLTASWVFDEEMAKATERFYAASRGKQQQFIGFKQQGNIIQPDKSHANYNLKFIPLEDGMSFTLHAFFADSSRIRPVYKFAKSPLLINRICGPVKRINDTTFQLNFNRVGFNNPKRSFDIWMLAYNKGDEKYKSAVQQIDMKFPTQNNIGVAQVIQFDSIANQKKETASVKLNAVSSSGLPVCFYVREGPAYMDGSIVRFTKIPPGAKFPIKVTVVAWQYGIAGKVQTAKHIEHTFYLMER